VNGDDFRRRMVRVVKYRLANQARVERMLPDTLLLQKIGDWAALLPESAWTPGVPPINPLYLDLVAVRTSTGKILSGRVDAFGGRMLERIERYTNCGVVIAWVRWQQRNTDVTY